MTDGTVSRSALMAALVSSSAADQSCRGALANGAGFDVRASSKGPVAELIRIYERRVRHVLDRGIATVGADVLIDRLKSIDAEEVRLGIVHSEDFNFTLFLDVDELQVLACVGVAASAANPDWDWSHLSS